MTHAPTTVNGVVDLAVAHDGGELHGWPAWDLHAGVSNFGSAATTAPITLTDTLPAGLTYASQWGWVDVLGNGWVVTCTNAGPMAGGASDPVTVTVGVAAGAVPSVTDTVRVATTGDVNGRTTPPP